MTLRRWIGAAADRKQLDTVTIANTWTAGDTITLTINNVTFVVTIGTLVTTAQVATTLSEAFNGSTLTDTTASYTPNVTSGAGGIPLFAEILGAVSGSTVTFTGRTAGVPFTMTCTESTASTGTATLANTITATGKNFFSDQDNWSGNAVPVDNDDIVFDFGNVDCLYGLTPAIQPASFTRTMGHTGKVGLPDMNPGVSGNSADMQYAEYRTKYLTFDDNSVTCTYTMGQGSGQGSGRCRIDAGAGRATINCYGTGNRTNEAFPSFEFVGTHASNAITVFDGDVGIAFVKGQTTVVATLRTGTDINSTARVFVGTDTTLTTSVQSGGNLTLNVSCTTHTQTGGTCTQIAGAPATLVVDAGLYNDQSSTTIATAVSVASGAKYDRSKTNVAKTITPLVNLHKDSTFLDPNETLTMSNGFKLNGCTLAECKIDLGRSRTFTVA